jgi:excisionase family DNA binding protein
MQEKLFTPEQVAEHLQISKLTLMEYLREGKLRGTKVGRLWRVAEGDLQDFVARGKALHPKYETIVPPAWPISEADM